MTESACRIVRKRNHSLMQDPHPLHYLRVNATVQQFNQFLEAFDITEGDGMYLDSAARVLVW